MSNRILIRRLAWAVPVAGLVGLWFWKPGGLGLGVGDPSPKKLKAAGWVQLKSDRTADLWVLTTTYFCQEQTGVECPPGRNIASQEPGDVYGSAEACEADVAMARDTEAKAARATAGLYASYREKALKGEYVPPD
jgi:hypothetical protein